MSVFTGAYELVSSPSGLFATMCLAVMTVLTWHNPTALGSGVWVAFFGIVPAILVAAEHREEMAKMAAQQPSTDSDMPDKGK